MLQLPYLKEIFRYMCIAQPDLCRADDLRDPENHMPIKKGLSIATTSKSLFFALEPLKCSGDHDHQAIEGSTRLHGRTIARSVFTEIYPRRFARRVAQELLRKKFPERNHWAS